MKANESLTVHWVKPDEVERLAQVRELFEEYQRELGICLCFQGFDEELATLPGKYAPPSGALMLAFDGDSPAACGALRDLGDGICEMKRLYVRPAYRGSGLGRSFTETLMARAKEIGYRSMRLDTLRRLAPAVNLYRALGFYEVAPYNFNPEPDIVYLERDL